MSSKDLEKPPSLVGLSWAPSDVAKSVDEVVEYAIREAQGAIDWYLRAKRPKQRWARGLRFSAIVLAAVAGILPMLTQIGLSNGPDSLLPDNPAWASVLALLAGALVLTDRFFGFSSAWVRYMTAELHLRQLLQEFNLDWEAEKASWKSAPPTDEQIQKAIARSKNFVIQVNTIVREETSRWVAEFQETLKEFDEMVKAKASATTPGAITVSVTNGDACDPPQWTVVVDGGGGEKHSGKTAALSPVSPGVRHIRVEGRIQNQIKRAEVAVMVTPGSIATAELTLA